MMIIINPFESKVKESSLGGVQAVGCGLILRTHRRLRHIYPTTIYALDFRFWNLHFGILNLERTASIPSIQPFDHSVIQPPNHPTNHQPPNHQKTHNRISHTSTHIHTSSRSTASYSIHLPSPSSLVRRFMECVISVFDLLFMTG